MAVATDRLFKRLERLRIKADNMVTAVPREYEFTSVTASSSFKLLRKKAMAVCIVDPLWRIVYLSAPELMKCLHEVHGYASLDVYWLKSLPKILYELRSVLVGLEESRKVGILGRHLWEAVMKDEEVISMLEKMKGMLADYFPVFNDETSRVNGVIEELKTVIDVMLIFCHEVNDPDEEFAVFDVASRTLLGYGFTERQIQLLTVAGRLPLKSSIEEEETIVGFEDDTIKVLERLTGITRKLEVIPIVGMAGLGKTTLARKVYRDPFIMYCFDIRAWSYVSQAYVKKDLLLGILSSIIQLTERIYSMSDEQLGEQVYRTLKGQKYLLVLDDIWDNRAWGDLKIYFPDDRNGSRILLTSRNIDLNLEVTAAAPPHRLRLRTEHESWRILQMKVFENGICPWRLYEVGKQISRKCRGLPLAVSITAGLLRNKWTLASWKQVAESLSKYIVSDPNQYMETLALSYNHLPLHLRPCFLYLGAFPGDCEIPVHKLIWLWVAHGFINQNGNKNLEDIGEDYLMDLLRRSLVIVSKRGADGKVKACHVHDLLRSLCLWKAEEENFSPLSYRYGRVSSALSGASNKSTLDQSHGGSSEVSTQHVHFLLCCPVELGESLEVGRSVDCETYKFLRILDVESISILSFPCEVVKLVHLRYLAIQAEDGNPPVSISTLSHLQILIISSRRNVIVPSTTLDMECLRHLCIRSGENLLEDCSPEEMLGNDCHPRVLDNLQTLSGFCPSPSFLSILSKTPNLRELGFHGPLISNLGALEFPDIRSLNCLQMLKLSNTKNYPKRVKSCSPLMFPERLMRLTLSSTALDWKEMGTFGVLPNLEVLKLKVNACIGQRWETSDIGFPRLKLLKLQDLNIVQWEASNSHFPRLQRLVVRRCSGLKEIPFGLGDILTLELIEVSWCNESAAQSASKIQEEQQRNGNDFLKVSISVHRDLIRNRKRPRCD